MIVVSDTSVITSLIQIGQLEVLQKLHGQVLIPVAVRDELAVTHQSIPSFLEVRLAQDRKRVSQLEIELDPGEAEAIVLAKEVSADLLLIDEKLGRQIAAREGIPIAGLVGLVIEAKQQGHVASVREFLLRLETGTGFRISNPVRTEALRRAGE
jgi:uncharacterized protein